MSFVLRPDQTEMYDQTRQLMVEGVHNILCQAPTGFGKTVLTAQMFHSAAAKSMTSWFVVHRRELVMQSVKAFSRAKIRHGIICGGFIEDPRYKIQICSVQTLVNRHSRLPRPRLIGWDEAHHIAAGSWAKIINAHTDAFNIGLTATPQRLDGTGLGKFFQKMVLGPSTAKLIDTGWLCPFVLYAPTTINTKGIHTNMGDFVQKEISRAADKPTITGSAIREYLKRSAGKRGVIFCASVEHSIHVVEQFKAAGVRAQHVDGKTESSIRDKAVKDLDQGKLDLLSNVDLFGEGFDLPAIEVVIDLSPTQSVTKFLQRCGRALRPLYADGLPLETELERRLAIAGSVKPFATILDHAGNWERHGLPDQEREWSLEGKAKGLSSASGGVSVRRCMKCFAAASGGRDKCPHCGTPYEINSRTIEEVDGDLVEIDSAGIKAQEIQKRKELDRDFFQLLAIAKKRGYYRPEVWANHVLKTQGKPEHRRPDES